MKKRILSMLLVLLMVVTLVPMGASAETTIVASGSCGVMDGNYGEVTDNVKWSLDSSGVLTISGSGEMAWYGCVDGEEGLSPWGQNVKAVIVEEGVTTVGLGAFFNCKQLTSVTLPNSVYAIRMSAFMGCESLKSIILPEGVELIGSGAFGGCKALKTIYLPKTLTAVGEFTFAACYSLKDVYYAGSETEWKQIEFGNDSDPTNHITIHYNFKAPVEPVTPSGFTDIPSDAFYANAVKWAVENEITTGVGNNRFDPNGQCTRGQVVTFLWRAAGKPTVSANVSFSDVQPGAFYYEAVKWAVANGITTGVGGNRFAPNDSCTRGQVVTFLHRAENSPSASTVSSFTDVPSDAFYYNAVNWAVENGITSGVGNNRFAPNDTCTRAQVVTFLYRAQ